MSALNKPLDSINESDLRALITNAVPESKTIEYKEALPGNSDSEKKEFLADASSFANAVGGDLIFGIKEESGVATELSGLQISDPDAEINRLESSVRDGIQPRITGLSSRAIPFASGAYAVILRIRKSWTSPHMVTYKGHSRFYSRTSTGKYPLDVTELRAAFTMSETAIERIRNFRIDRLGKVASGETPVPLENNAKIVLHLIPVDAFDPSTRYDISSVAKDLTKLYPIYSSSIFDNRYNFDGYLTYSQFPNSSSAHSYLQIFRNGIIEAVEAYMIRQTGDDCLIGSLAFEKELINALPRLLEIQKRLGVEPPDFVMLGLLGVRGYSMAVDSSRFPFAAAHPIDRDALILPEIMLDTLECDASQILKPIFDSVWNATGWPRSMSYDENGKWRG